MKIPTEIKNWLLIAFQQEIDDTSEYFYFDKKKNEFFSIHIIDHYLFDKKTKIIKGVSVYFTNNEISIIRDRFKKIKQKNTSIILLPRLGIVEDTSFLLKEIEEFIVQYKIEINSTTLFEVYQKEPIIHDSKSKNKKQWWRFWDFSFFKKFKIK